LGARAPPGPGGGGGGGGGRERLGAVQVWVAAISR